MAEFQQGQIVFSKRGRDQGRAFVVVKTQGEFLYLCDGRLRTLEKLKKKKIKHVQPTNYVDLALSEKIVQEAYLLDADIRRAIDCYRASSK